MKHFNLRGTGVALVTPFNSDNSIDTEALASHVERLVSGGVDYLVVLGTTAETPTLAPKESETVKQCVIRAAAGRIPLVLGVGGNCTDALVGRLKTEDFSGFSAILSVVPYYNKPTQEGMYRHFKAIAEASPLPVILYNIPGRTGVNMLPSTVLRIAREFPQVIGIKEASGKTEQVEEIVKSKPEGFDVVSGDDGLTLAFIDKGAAGVISVAANCYPRRFSRMVRMALDGDETCRETDRGFSEFYRLLFADGNPAGIKCALNLKYGMPGNLRLPLVAVNEETRRQMAAVTQSLADD